MTPPATCSMQTVFSPAGGEVSPLPLLPPPAIPASTSARARNKYTKKLRLWKYAVGLNFMHVGTSRLRDLVDTPSSFVGQRWSMNRTRPRKLWRHLLHISKDGLRVCREVPPTGGQPAVAALVKSAKVDAMVYATVSKTSPFMQKYSAVFCKCGIFARAERIL